MAKSFSLSFDSEPTKEYPHGYWYAYSEIMGIDADGPDPLSAVSGLAIAMEEKWKNDV